MPQGRRSPSACEPHTPYLAAASQASVTRWNPNGEARGVSTAADYVESRRADNARRKTVFLKALEASMGVVSVALKLTNLSRTTYRDWCLSDATFKRQAEEITEWALDFSEAQLLRLIGEGDILAIAFFLRTKGRKRGYGTAQQK